jgi:hypothetical protein
VTEHDGFLDGPRGDFNGEQYEEDNEDYEGDEDARKVEAASSVYWKMCGTTPFR